MLPETANCAPQLPLLLTMGDPAGIGPEIIARAFTERPDLSAQVVVVGDVPTMVRATALVSNHTQSAIPALVVEIPETLDSPDAPLGCMRVVQACHLKQFAEMGRISAVAGRAAADCIRWAASATLDGRARGLVTAPVHKEALAAAGVVHPGHTEMLQALAAEHQGVTVASMPVRMMLECPGLKTVLVSIHISLRQAIEAVTTDRVLQTIRIAHAHFHRIGIVRPRIAVAGLNPHAGEGGLFGLEEGEAVAPAVVQARLEGVDASGPHAPDTVFMRAREGHFDVVVAMYHDQGLIPVKLMGLDHGVNTTLGLPFVRTSPDHGTAFDIAGTGVASASSLLAAIDAALAASTC